MRRFLACLLCFGAVGLTSAACTTEVVFTNPADPPGPLPETNCDDYLQPDYAQIEPFEVTLRNDSPDWVYLDQPACGSGASFDIFANGERVDLAKGFCRFTCDDLQQGEAACPAVDCATRVVAIAPGGVYTMAWDGFVGRDVDMPAACYYDPTMAQDTCTMRVPAEDGAYELRLLIHREIDCPMGDPCECTPDQDGVCELESYPVGAEGMSIEVNNTIDYPKQKKLDIAIDGASDPDPEPEPQP